MPAIPAHRALAARRPAAVRPSPDRPRRANAPGQRARTAAHASESTTSGPTRVGATRKSTHQGRSPRPYTRGPQRTRDPRRALPDPPPPIRSSPASPPSPPFPALYLRSSDRFPGSFFMVLMLLSVPSCLPPPRLRPSTLHAWAALPGVCLQVEEGGSSAKRWTPLPRKPRRRAKSGPEAGRRPVDLLERTARGERRETNNKNRTPSRGDDAVGWFRNLRRRSRAFRR